MPPQHVRASKRPPRAHRVVDEERGCRDRPRAACRCTARARLSGASAEGASRVFGGDAGRAGCLRPDIFVGSPARRWRAVWSVSRMGSRTPRMCVRLDAHVGSAVRGRLRPGRSRASPAFLSSRRRPAPARLGRPPSASSASRSTAVTAVERTSVAVSARGAESGAAATAPRLPRSRALRGASRACGLGAPASAAALGRRAHRLAQLLERSAAAMRRRRRRSAGADAQAQGRRRRQALRAAHRRGGARVRMASCAWTSAAQGRRAADRARGHLRGAQAKDLARAG